MCIKFQEALRHREMLRLYREMKNVSYLRGEPGEVDNTERVKGDNYDNLYIKIPAGKKAVGSTVK